MRALAAIGIALFLVLFGAMPASASSSQKLQRNTRQLSATWDRQHPNGPCPFAIDAGPDSTIGPEESVVGTIARPGPDLQFSGLLCTIFSGSVCGLPFQGEFTLSGPEGSLQGTMTGADICASFGVVNAWVATLSITRGTRAYANSGGMLAVVGCDLIVANVFLGPLSDTMMGPVPPWQPTPF